MSSRQVARAGIERSRERRQQAVYARRDGTVVYVLPWTDGAGERVVYEQDADFTTERVTLDDDSLREIAATGQEIPVSCTPGWCDLH